MENSILVRWRKVELLDYNNNNLPTDKVYPWRFLYNGVSVCESARHWGGAFPPSSASSLSSSLWVCAAARQGQGPAGMSGRGQAGSELVLGY